MKAQRITRALGGDWHGSYGTVPAPGHSHKDRSVSIRPHSSDPDDVVIYSFTGEDPLAIKDELRRHGLLPKRSSRSPRPMPQRLAQDVPGMTPEAEAAQRSRDTALGLWRRSQPILGTLAERYLRNVRRIEGALPPTLRFLPANGRHPPAMVAAFGLPDETDPDAMTIEASALRGVHLTKLCLDGRGKADMEPNKIMLGRGHTLPIVLAPMNDMGGLAITEGIEDALSIHMATGLGVWAAGSAPRLPGLAKHVPANIMCVTVFIDADPAGERFGSVLAERLEARGFEVIAKHWAEAGHGS